MGTLAGKHHLMLALSLLLLGLTVCSATARDLSGKLYPDKPPVMTIKTEHGDLVDCVDFYSQPAFGHPALQNHILQMEPNSPQDEDEDEVPERILHTAEDKANWRRSRSGSRMSCPPGTVPILRRPENLSSAFTTKYGHAGSDIHEYAVVRTRGTFNGTIARFNVWNPHVDSRSGYFSLTQLWISSEADPFYINTIEAGFHVNPWLYAGDKYNYTRLFTYWTTDDYRSSGCYNLLCAGFVQLSSEIYPGMVVSPVSAYKGNQVYVKLAVIKGAGRWALIYGSKRVGYWPDELFTSLGHRSATGVDWGGETNRRAGQPCGATQMGSGHFPSEGRDGISSYVKNIMVVDANGNPAPPTHTEAEVTKKECYDIDNVGMTYEEGYLIYFGGPGSK